jgi:hypothetical protein
VARLGLLVALPAVLMPPVALGGGQAAELEAPQDPPDPGLAQADAVVTLQVHRDLQGAEVVVLAQVDDLADHLFARGPGTQVRLRRAVAQALLAELLAAPPPLVEALYG